MTDAIVLRDAIYDRLATGFVVDWARTDKAPVPSIQPTDLPHLGVYFLDDQMRRDGDGGGPAFTHLTTIVVSMGAKHGDAAVLEHDLDAWMEAAKERLLTDPSFVAMSEQVDSIRTTRIMPREGEFFFADMRMAITLQYRSEWAPKVTDDFESVRIDARYPRAETDPAIVQQVGAEWDVPQN